MLNTSGNSDAKVAFALVKQPGRWASSQNLVDNDDDKWSLHPDSQTSMLHLPHREVALANTKMTTPCQWYEYYAKRYPSIGYLETERQKQQQEEETKRQRLALGLDLSGSGSGSGRGWFRRLWFFGRRNNGAENVEAMEGNEESDGIGRKSSEGEHFDHVNDGYFDEEKNPTYPSGYLGNDGMCGTASHFDHEAIPHEAFAFHRFHLASERRSLAGCRESGVIDQNGSAKTCDDNEEKGTNDPNDRNVVLPVRRGAGWESSIMIGAKADTHFSVVGYGMIAEFPSSAKHVNNRGTEINSTEESKATLTLTSDRQHLLQIVESNEPIDFRHARASCIGPDCLAISWGMGDGWVVFYRRVCQQKQKNGRKTQQKSKEGEHVVETGWETVAIAHPSRPILDTAINQLSPSPYTQREDVSLDELLNLSQNQQLSRHQVEHLEELRQGRLEQLYETGSLCVSDLVPIIVDNGTSNPPSAILTISRLGGFVEILPIPEWVWLPNHLAAQNSSAVEERLQYRGYVPNLMEFSDVKALSTSQYHIDITAMDAYLTNDVGTGDGSHIEIVLASCGRARRREMEEMDCSDDLASGNAHYEDNSKASIVLWGISRMFPQSTSDENGIQIPSRGSNTISDFNVVMLGGIDLDNIGTDNSVFLSENTTHFWAKLQTSPSAGNKRKRRLSRTHVPCSVTTVSPLVSLRFAPNVSTMQTSRVLVAALDYNGGISVIDCTQVLQPGRVMHDTHFSNGNNSSQHTLIANPAISLLNDRTSIMTVVSSTGKQGGFMQATQMEWWYSESYVNINHEDNLLDPSSLCSFLLATSGEVKRNFQTGRKVYSAIRLQRVVTSYYEGNELQPRDIFFLPIGSANGFSVPSTMLLPVTLFDPDETLLCLRIEEISFRLTTLCQLGVKKISNPTEIISHLLQRRSDPARALAVAKQFGGADKFGGSVMNECQTQLWEDGRDVQALKLVSDDVYVINEIFELDRNFEGYMKAYDDMTLDDLSQIYLEAYNRCEKLSAMKNGIDPQWIHHNALRFSDSIRRIGTFQLLQRQYKSNGDIDGNHLSFAATNRFLRGFRHFRLSMIASSAAIRGDIDALTLLFARHPMSTQTRMKVLELIPLDTEIPRYEHLLPCFFQGGSGDGKFLLKAENNHTYCFDALQLFSHYCTIQQQGQFPFEVFVDELDKDHLLSHYWCQDQGYESNQSISREEISLWYLRRAIDIHNRTGQISFVRQLTESALSRLSVQILRRTEENGAVENTVYLYSCAELLHHILVDKMKESFSLEFWTATRELFTPVLEFCSMELSTAVSFILQSSNSSMFNLSLFRKHVEPFVCGDEVLVPIKHSSESHADLASKIENDLIDMCLNKFTSLRQNAQKMAATKVGLSDTVNSEQLKEALSASYLLASFGILDKEGNTPRYRIIRSDGGLVGFVVRVFDAAMKSIHGNMRIIEPHTIDQLWSLFELLPAPVKNSNPKINFLYSRLLAIQLLHKWSGGKNRSLEVWASANFNLESNNEGSSVINFEYSCTNIIRFISERFCDLVLKDSIGTNQRNPDILLDFLSDVEEFDQIILGCQGVQTGIVGSLLQSVLLPFHLFSVLRDIMQVRPSWFCFNKASAAVVSCIRSFSLEGHVETALSCHDVFAPLFSKQSDEFAVIRRYLDALQFSTFAMKLDRHLVRSVFSQFGSASPIDLIRHLIESRPEILLLGCEFWRDENSAANACADASKYFSLQIHESLRGNPVVEASHVLPPMPGALVMQLANILGVTTPHELLRVKRCMASGAIQLGIPYAAVAVVYSMLCDCAFLNQGEHQSEDFYCLVVSSVMMVLDILDDVMIKMDLCKISLRMFSTNHSPLHDTLLETFIASERELLRKESALIQREEDTRSCGQVDNHQSQGNSGFAMIGGLTTSNCFRHNDIAKIVHEINRLSSADVTALLSSFSPKTAMGIDFSTHEENLKALGEYCLNWAIPEMVKSGETSSCNRSQSYKISMMIELGAVCLGEVRDQEASLSVVDRALDSHEKEASRFRAQSPMSSNRQTPDPSIVQKLNERGYTWNAARRAAIMTKNQSYSAALTWAVSHFADSDFDAPLLFLREENSSSVDSYLIHLTGSLLRRVKEDMIKRKTSRMKSTMEVSPSPAISGQTNTTAAKSSSNSSKQAKDGGSLVSSVSVESTKATNADFTFCVSNHSNLQTASEQATLSATAGESHVVFSIEEGDEKGGTFSEPRNRPDLMLKIPGLPANAEPLETPRNDHSSEGPVVPNSGGSISSIEGSLSSRASVKRQIQRGKAYGVQKLSAEERKKLALNGKRLLEARKAESQAKSKAVPSSISTSSKAM